MRGICGYEGCVILVGFRPRLIGVEGGACYLTHGNMGRNTERDIDTQ